ncbi:ABC transporter permease [Deinococcus yavapaiensis]|uniref:Monosaccharide ABC transporter membrane protein (CUT2 family) n=1 Tax=Deinococcus yavapaiensis KR-236 TaxID=694435 RepID=A0A318S7X3_9DEIO|nr:ABC transporter permease [Deinococcus yavapaiensis]PYE54967.1 monosaccharide ABC transporter membrane protein (CUT2 family) [Deinococcus yavapaiensis KR-236]
MSTPTSEAVRPAKRPNILARIGALGPLLGLILLAILATSLNSDFASISNVSNVLTRAAFTGIIAVGMTFVIVSGGIDLSVGSLAALTAGSMILIMNSLIPTLGSGTSTILVGMLIALAIGALAGLAHGTLIARGRIEPFIVTLGTLGLFRSVLTYLSNGGAISLNDTLSEKYSPVYYGSVLGVPIPILVFALVALLGGLLLNRTRYGRYVQAIGSNEQVARYAAIDVTRIKILTYVLLGVCVAIATILYVPRLGSASPSTGLLWELEAIAAVIIGGTALKGGSGRIWGTVVGAILLVTIENVLNLTNLFSVYLNAAVQGVVIIIVAFLQRGRRT